MTRCAFAMVCAALFGIGTAAAGCGAEAPRMEAPKRDDSPSWSDIFDGTPEFYAVIRPRAMKHDGVYGTFFKALMRVAEARGIARGDTMVRAAESADEIIVGMNGGGDAAIVLRGVPASLDPAKITDADGRALFQAPREPAAVVEYEALQNRGGESGSLFVLPNRTWVGAMGEARSRARQAFVTPQHRPVPKVDAESLAVVRVSGRLPHVLDRHPRYGVLSKKLSSATFMLKPAKAGLVVGLTYEDPDATAWAEMQAKQLIEELSSAPDRAWLKEAKVAYEDKTVFVRVAVPPRLLEELPNASGADFGL